MDSDFQNHPRLYSATACPDFIYGRPRPLFGNIEEICLLNISVVLRVEMLLKHVTELINVIRKKTFAKTIGSSNFVDKSSFLPN